MKWLLISWVCSAIAMGCKDPLQSTIQYNTYQECIGAGYTQGLKYNNNLPKDFVNQHLVYMKFTCKEVNET
jgi:hypothetical protein